MEKGEVFCALTAPNGGTNRRHQTDGTERRQRVCQRRCDLGRSRRYPGRPKLEAQADKSMVVPVRYYLDQHHKEETTAATTE